MRQPKTQKVGTFRFVTESNCSESYSARHFLSNSEWCLEKALERYKSLTVGKINCTSFDHAKDGDLVFHMRTHLFGHKTGQSIEFICDGLEEGHIEKVQLVGIEDDLTVLKCTTLQSHLFCLKVGEEDRPFTVGDYQCLEKAPKDCSGDNAKKHWYTENVIELSVQQLRADVEKLNMDWVYKVVLLTP